MFDGGPVTNVPRKQTLSSWQKWFAWRPVKVHNKWVWFKTVYRRVGNTYVDHDNWTWYHYGTIFDVIRGDE